MKRIIIASLSGLLFGFVCFGFACSSGELPLPVSLQIIASRTLIGVTIGISVLKMPWVWHGLLIGGIYSLPLAFSGLMGAEDPNITPSMMLVSTLTMGLIYGLLIEVITTVLFKAKRQS